MPSANQPETELLTKIYKTICMSEVSRTFQAIYATADGPDMCSKLFFLKNQTF